jgi:hypothetical protein
VNRAVRQLAAPAILAIVGAVLAFVAGGCGSASSPPASRKTAKSSPPATNKLLATVNIAGQVTLTTSNGHTFARLHNGWYTVFVRINSTRADFHLTGPSVSSATKVGVPGVALWGLHLLKGTYHYMNDRDAHAATHVFYVY